MKSGMKVSVPDMNVRYFRLQLQIPLTSYSQDLGTERKSAMTAHLLLHICTAHPN